MTELPPRIPDEELVRAEIADAALEEREISDAAASTIASWHCRHDSTALREFKQTGSIDRLRIENEYVAVYSEPQLSDFDRLALDYLGTYLLHAEGVDQAGNRGPVEGWTERSQWSQA